jgi:dolichyl-phosphate beta-glucosyltransferase
MDATQLSISIVIPVYNEEKRITSFLEKILTYLAKRDFSYELVFVDDGSTDSTITTIESFLQGKLSGTFTIVRFPANRGKGAAIREGMLKAAGKYIFFTDADGSTPIEEIDHFLPHLSADCDVYLAIRTLKQKAPFKRKLFGYGYIILANLLLRLKVSDITCGFKCYSHPSAKKIFSLQRLNNWSFDAEDIFIARKYGYRIKEIPVTWKHVSGSKVKVLKNVFLCGLDLFKIRFHDINNLYS